jgi:hypothetical protein
LHGHFPTTVPAAIEAGRWIDHEWLFEFAAAWSSVHGLFAAFAAACLVAYVAAPVFLYSLLRRLRYSDLAAGWATMLFAMGEEIGLAVRAQTFAYYPCALELFLLWSGLSRPWLFLLIAAVWANLHGSGVLAPALPLLFAIGYAIQRDHDAARRSLLGVGCAFVGTLLTPNGLGLWTYSLAKMLPYNAAISVVDEWQPISFVHGVAWLVLLPALLTLTFKGVAEQRKHVSGLLLTAAFFVLATHQIRHTAFFAAAAVVSVAQGIEGVRALTWLQRRRYHLLPFLVAAIAACALVVPRLAVKLSPDPPGPWRAATQAARDLHIKGNVYAPYRWAAYLPAHGLPLHILIDAHGDPFGAAVWRDYITITLAQPGWLEVLDQRAITAIFVEEDDALARALRRAAGWRLVTREDGLDVFTREAYGAMRHPPAHADRLSTDSPR